MALVIFLVPVPRGVTTTRVLALPLLAAPITVPANSPLGPVLSVLIPRDMILLAGTTLRITAAQGQLPTVGKKSLLLRTR